MDGSTLGVKKKFKEYRIKTESAISEIESTLNEFEKNGDSQQLYDRVKETIKKFTINE